MHIISYKTFAALHYLLCSVNLTSKHTNQTETFEPDFVNSVYCTNHRFLPWHIKHLYY